MHRDLEMSLVMAQRKKSNGRLIALVVIAFVVVGLVLWLFGPADLVASAFDRDRIRGWIDTSGVWGPVLIVALMTIAIVASPIPSAPIALAAGAAYGQIYGTILVIAGAELGALIAFVIARFLGRAALEHWFGEKIGAGLLGSQNALTFLVFASRLLPFVSFDIMSYAAGLSVIHFWRFAVATLAGIVPASFVLAYLGNEAMSGNAATAGWTAALLGFFTLLSVGVAAAVQRRRQKTQTEASE